MIAVLAAAVIAAKPVYLFATTLQSAAVVDHRTVKVMPGGLQQFELVAIFARGTPFRGQVMHVSTTPNTIDCVRNRISYGATTYMTLAGGILIRDAPDPQANRWAPIPPRSILINIKTWLCDGTPPTDARAGPVEDLHHAEQLYFAGLGRPEEMAGR